MLEMKYTYNKIRISNECADTRIVKIKICFTVKKEKWENEAMMMRQKIATNEHPTH